MIYTLSLFKVVYLSVCEGYIALHCYIKMSLCMTLLYIYKYVCLYMLPLLSSLCGHINGSVALSPSFRPLMITLPYWILDTVPYTVYMIICIVHLFSNIASTLYILL